MSEIIKYSDTPKTDSWQLERLFKRDSKDKTRFWEIRYDHDRSALFINYGQIGGKDPEDIPVDVTVNQSGKDIQQQALSMANTRYLEKIRKGYSTTMDDYFTPQLAIVYKFPGKTGHKKTAITEKNFTDGIAVQYKYDGNRAYCKIRPHGVEMYSRVGVEMVYLEQVKRELLLIFDNLPEDTIIDGELYHPDGLQVLQSIIKTKGQRHSQMDEVKYYVFDVYIPSKKETEYIARRKCISDAFGSIDQSGDYISLVDHWIIHSIAELHDIFDKSIKTGCEGIVVRKCIKKESYYTTRRNNNWLKIKPVDDAEGIVVAVNEAKNADSGTAVFVLELPSGIRVKCRPAATREQRRIWWENPDTCIGKQYTYYYNGLTRDGKPFHIRGKGFR